METLKTPSMHHRLGSMTLFQLAFPGDSSLNFPSEKSVEQHSCKKKKMHSVFVCSVCCGFQQGSVLLTLVTQRMTFHVCLQCLKCSSQFTKGQAHTVIHREVIAHTGSSKDFKSMADTGGEDINDKGTG